VHKRHAKRDEEKRRKGCEEGRVAIKGKINDRRKKMQQGDMRRKNSTERMKMINGWKMIVRQNNRKGQAINIIGRVG